mmetsp:Transcript_22915/g.54287  ORF Transcript_22915/g.54287 Transcript_22915/m.54287 type:complete len:204 (+) Transcript_22915:158-769(+)
MRQSAALHIIPLNAFLLLISTAAWVGGKRESNAVPWHRTSSSSSASLLALPPCTDDIPGVLIETSSSMRKPARPPLPLGPVGSRMYLVPMTRRPSWLSIGSMLLSWISDRLASASMPMKPATSDPTSVPKMRVAKSLTGTDLARNLKPASISPALAEGSVLSTSSERDRGVVLCSFSCCFNRSAVSVPNGCREARNLRQKRFL